MKALFKKNQVKGFTLIELVIVIVLLGILAATALPKFANLTGQAYLAVARGVAGSLGDAVSIAYSQWLAEGQPQTNILLQDGTVVKPFLSAVANQTNGYPESAAAAGQTPPAGTAGQTSAVKCQAIWQNLMQNPPAVAASGGTPAVCGNQTSCFVATAPTATTCQFQDQNGTGNIITYNIATGNVTAP